MDKMSVNERAYMALLNEYAALLHRCLQAEATLAGQAQAEVTEEARSGE